MINFEVNMSRNSEKSELAAFVASQLSTSV